MVISFKASEAASGMQGTQGLKTTQLPVQSATLTKLTYNFTNSTFMRFRPPFFSDVTQRRFVVGH